MSNPTINLRGESKESSGGLTKLAVILVAIIITGILLLGWSVWYWTYHPESYTSTMEFHQRCEEDSTTPYCYGYAAGYNWCVDQVDLQKELDKINPYK